MSDLPSREAFVHTYHAAPILDKYLPPGWRIVLREFGSGRLVDREAIDYEAGLAYLLKIWVMVYGEEPGQQVRAILWDGIQGGVAAAIGDGE